MSVAGCRGPIQVEDSVGLERSAPHAVLTVPLARYPDLTTTIRHLTTYLPYTSQAKTLGLVIEKAVSSSTAKVYLLNDRLCSRMLDLTQKWHQSLNTFLFKLFRNWFLDISTQSQGAV